MGRRKRSPGRSSWTPTRSSWRRRCRRPGGWCSASRYVPGDSAFLKTNCTAAMNRLTEGTETTDASEEGSSSNLAFSEIFSLGPDLWSSAHVCSVFHTFKWNINKRVEKNWLKLRSKDNGNSFWSSGLIISVLYFYVETFGIPVRVVFLPSSSHITLLLQNFQPGHFISMLPLKNQYTGCPLLTSLCKIISTTFQIKLLLSSTEFAVSNTFECLRNIKICEFIV